MQLLKWWFFLCCFFICLFKHSKFRTMETDSQNRWQYLLSHPLCGWAREACSGGENVPHLAPKIDFIYENWLCGCCRRLYFLRLPFCWQSWGCDNCRAGCNVVSEYAALLQVLQLSLDFSLVNCPLQRGRGGALWMLVAQLLFCQKPVIHLFLGCEPRLHSSLPHTGYKDIVSFCGAAQTWVLQKCCLICFWFEVSSRVIVERKATAIMGVDSKG